LLIVNTASKCGFTPQYKSLQKLHETYQTWGFEVLAFPSNDFGNQEPGTHAEIKQFCRLKFNVTFPLFSKISVKGKDIHPLYQHLTKQTDFKGSIKWNFTKFLVDGNGQVVARYSPMKDPLSKDVTSKLKSLLEHEAGRTA
jgi:glutathione peroxidase